MAVELKKKGWTYAEYAALGEAVQAELIDGVLLMTPAPGFRHAMTVEALLSALFVWRHQQGLKSHHVLSAPVDLFLRGAAHQAEGSVIQPDILVVAPDGPAKLIREGVEGAPLLVVEVESPSSTKRDALTKRALYARAGVPEYWFVRPEGRRVEVFTQAQAGNYPTPALYEDGAELSSPLLPGFALAIAELFGPIDPEDLG